MAVLWLILKIIGWIILGLLGFLIVGISLLLLAPIHYDIYFEKYETMMYKVNIDFLKVIKAQFEQEGDIQKKEVRCFWKIWDMTLKESDENLKKEGQKEQKLSPILSKDKKAITKDSRQQTKHSPNSSNKQRISKEQERVKKKKSRIDVSLLWNRMTYDLIREVIICIKNIIKMILPNEWSFELVIGKEDPAETGESIAKLILLYPLYYRHGIIRANEECVGTEGGFLAEGRFRLGTLIKILLVFLLKPSVRAMIKRFLKKS